MYVCHRRISSIRFAVGALIVRAKSQLGQKTSNLSNARDCALPTCLNEARATSDYCSEECAIKGIELEALQAVMNKDPRPAAIMIPPAKSSAQAAARKLSSPVQPLSPIQLKSPGSPKAEQNPVRSTALKGLTDSLMVAFENKPQQQEADLEKASRLAAVIEKELYMFTATPGQSGCGKDYKAKYRSLFFNLKDKNNESLRARVLSGELEPHELVRLTPEELANPELQSIAEEVRKRSIHDSVLTIEQEPFIKKTHKGDVSYIPGPSMMNESSSTSSTKPEDKDYDKEPNQDLTAEETPAEETVQAQQSSSKSTPVGSPTTDALDKLLARIQTNKRSGEEVLNDALTGEKRKKLSEGGPDGLAWVSSSSSYLPREPSPYSPSPSPSGSPALSSTTPPGSPPPLMLEGIERRLKSGASSASKQVLPVWQGTVYMHQVTKFFARAVQVGGSRVIPGRPSSDPLVEMIAPEWADILTKTVSIDGRIPTAAVASYVAQQRQSATKEVVVVQFELEDPSPASLEKRKAEFDKLFHYFYDKDRNGVVPNKGRHVKDMYLVPVASKDPLPVYLQNLMQVEALVRAREPRKDALFGVLIVNKASSHHHNRDHQHHHGQSPSHAKASSSHHRHSGASASRPYPTQHERRDSRESQSNGYTRRSSTVHSPSQQPPAVSSLFSIGTPMSAPASPSQNATSATPAITAPIKVPTLQELQGLVNQLFPAGNPGTPPVAISSPGSQTSQGLTPAAAAVTAQLSGTSASSLIAGLPANLAMNLGQTMAQFNQQQNVPVSHGQPYFARPPPPPLPAGMPIPPPGMPVPPPGFPPLPPHLLAQQQQGRPPMPIPPVPPMPPMAPHQLQAFLAQHQLQQQQGQQGQQGQPPQAMPPMSPFGPGFHPPPPRPNPQHVLQQQQQQQYQPYPPPSQGQWPEQTHHARPDQTRRRDWS
ncbi:transcription factor S-II, central domain-containing protein [Gamsiella multidivaricata]|uniref:transcription factor S-II, central domain-containing protein n=1 Tax=Gamsiella multidivaricata TaxID=101098 RepID=UPI002220AE83|nr:transcription factor S-II, central domain-containing protein [Gamsiella multidivaricata]KAI7828626.1 transcription factor S-II, central domain-containing protein [Gamsiella multidivaricata]